MYKVKNQSNDVRKFRDSFSGKDVFVEPGKFAITRTPVKESNIFKVEEIKEEKKNKANKLMEDDVNDS